jgi:hypothetical protein
MTAGIPDLITGENAGYEIPTQIYGSNQPRPILLGQTVLTVSTTLDARYNGLALYANSGSAFTLTFPSTLPPGFNCEVIQAGAGQVTCAADSAGTMNNRQSFTKTAGQYAVMSVFHRGNGTFILSGDGA